ncbi:hypothetical protein [Jeotgalibacillus soli]|uniref:Uncharacterized protein n=1 Tax=Jeotgalibacillus soli TaxID=889306 RepID=A0A0C2VSW5_9BACL|nr:hypothetical protein [Jeotgalibacillus soli]KIL51997.1 hypothetical protein KP78_03670 [Jeotgalibacillus soli]
MSIWLLFFLYANFLFASFTYGFLYRRRKLIGFHLGMNIAMMAGGGLALTTGVLLINRFPLHYVEITVAATIIGMVSGSLFGGMFDYQTLLSGYINGLISGLMAPMIGAAAASSLPFIFLLEIFFLSSFVILMMSSKFP